MNDLNSVLLDGVLTDDPAIYKGDRDHQDRLHFTLESHRIVKDRENDLSDMVTYIEVRVIGLRASICAERLRQGSKVRVVGRLGGCHDDVAVWAEHIALHLEDSR